MSVRSSVIRRFALESLASEEVRYRSLSFFFFVSLFLFVALLSPCQACTVVMAPLPLRLPLVLIQSVHSC